MTWVHFAAWLARVVSRAECPGTCQSVAEALPDPPASGRRFAEGLGSSGNEALLLYPKYDSEKVRLWTRRMKDCSPGGL